jgi:ring-1,2-phenylacetyl-CoA epoxidase subunit PaaD
MAKLTVDEIWQALERVKDPEIPVISVVEMGIVRDIAVSNDRVTVTMTPTFSGCPALHVIRTDIEAAVGRLTPLEVVVETVLYPPWSSDWISDDGRQKLKAFGLAPPARHGGNLLVTFYDSVACPYCESTNTTVKNDFGPTLCRAIHFCNSCRQPFEQFKAL